MSVFNADAYLAAIDKPAVEINGVVHYGRILSVIQFQPFIERIQAIHNGTSQETFLNVAQAYLYALFPKPRLPWKLDIVPHLLNHPSLNALIESFLATQVAALNVRPDHLTNGTSSPPTVSTSQPSETNDR